MRISSEFHAQLQATLQALSCDVGASECHGMLCGALSGPALFDQNSWLIHLSGGEEVEAYRSAAPQQTFDELVDATVAGLDDDDLSFSLLLPDDGVNLSVRAREFAAWSRGFLSGFGISGIVDLNQLGEDARGFLRDLERFGSIALGDDDNQEDEQALLELTEFARMGVLIVREEARDLGRDASQILN